jgi:hypothetical protein
MAFVHFFKFDTDGFQVGHDDTADQLKLLSLELAPGSPGDSVINLGGGRATNGADGTAATDLVTKQQLDAVSAGTDPKEAVDLATAAALPAYTQAGSGVGATLTANAVGILTVDGVATGIGDRILVKDEGASDADHGIYEVTTEGTAGVAFVLTRSTDYDGTPAGEVSQGSYTFVLGGTQINTGWMMITPDPITVDTTALQFTQFQGLASYVWGAGLLDTANTVSVELDGAADAQGAGNGGGNSGLEFDAAGDGGQLRLAVNATGGLERTATGAAAKLNGTTLESAAGGLSVKGVPALFEIGGVATGSNVTAPNLDELTGGGATTLHTHAGSDSSERVETTYTSDGSGVTIGDPIYCSANDIATEADAANNNCRKYIGLAKTTVGAAASLQVVSDGLLPGVTVAGSPAAGAIVYLAVGGGLTTVLPTGSGNHRLVVGKMKNASDVQIAPQYLGKIA